MRPHFNLMKIVFMGTPQAAVPSLERLVADGHEVVAVYTQPDRPSGRGHKLAASPVKESALQFGLQVVQPSKLRTDEALVEFENFGADLAVVVAYGRILPDAFLAAYPKGCVNVHFSLLPKFRGAAPVNWAIVNGESVTGVTTMQMDSGLDTGDILLQAETGIGSEENSIDLMGRLSVLGAELLSRTLDDLDGIVPRDQDDTMATLAPILKKEDGRFDWGLPAALIERRIRGFQPFPTTYTTFRGKRLTLWRAKVIMDHAGAASPGTILEAKGDTLIVTCGERSLRISELQIEGRKRVGVRDFLNGVNLQTGEQFV